MSSQWNSFKAAWSNNATQYQSLDSLHAEKANTRWYWRLIAQIATYMILGGYLILPTTFDSDQRLRFNKGVLAIIIVALLTGGYSLTGLVWFACPSTLFRLDHIFLPVFSVSLFAFFAACYALAASPRYVFSDPSAPTTLALTLASASVYGIFSLMMHRSVRRMTRALDQNPYGVGSTTMQGPYQDPAYYPQYAQSVHPSTFSPANGYEPFSGARSHASFDGAASMRSTQEPSEEELVNQQMAKLLTRRDLGLSQNASRSTFHLDWPQAEEGDHELEGGIGRRRQSAMDDSGRLLAPAAAGRKRSQSAGGNAGAWNRFSRAVGADPGSTRHQRISSRDDRRREIEMNDMHTR
ncbi:uncharacterized protein PV09_04022 [Verruconis gallopava]|uniref:Uncharacterized protein n=1 Tax=Verruconis gallopava TaxID=253628 RepID=A0A0D2AEF2_9PEZI|nr:uncharacterized protein PV09_04022 [Verruconis gallopava]KIW04840.1 hypothetical protein PV09_04022 [Verruconis gallopava]